MTEVDCMPRPGDLVPPGTIPPKPVRLSDLMDQEGGGT